MILTARGGTSPRLLAARMTVGRGAARVAAYGAPRRHSRACSGIQRNEGYSPVITGADDEDNTEGDGERRTILLCTCPAGAWLCSSGFPTPQLSQPMEWTGCDNWGAENDSGAEQSGGEGD